MAVSLAAQAQTHVRQLHLGCAQALVENPDLGMNELETTPPE
jgi:hypothetical protein